jgi:translation initiation factor IF-1
MVSLLKTVGVMSCSLLLFLGLSDVASSLDKIGDTQPGKTIKGEVLRIEGDNYFVKNGEDGKVVRLHVDNTTQKKSVRIIPGDNVEVKFNDQNHAISILTDQNQSH